VPSDHCRFAARPSDLLTVLRINPGGRLQWVALTSVKLQNALRFRHYLWSLSRSEILHLLKGRLFVTDVSMKHLFSIT
jgi:hypothetical protein